MSHPRRLILAVSAVAFAAASALSAQSFTGSILGLVSDSTGAIMPGIPVTAINQNTGERRGAVSTEAGQYNISALSPGNYTVEAEASGFKKHKRENVRVDTLLNVRADIRLEPGEVTEVVSVTAETPLLEAANASVGQVVENKNIVDLPLIGRNTITLVALTTGVQPAVVTQFGDQPVLTGPYNHGAFSLNSGIQMGSEFLLDGVPNNAFLWNAPAFVPSVDAVQEFKVQGSGLSAEFGHSGGGIVNLTTKSGTNRFHGTLFHFLRNDKLDANNFFNNSSGLPKPSLKTNEFGGSIGGPVMLPRYNGHNRTFFFASYDGFRDRRPSTTLTTVPIPEFRRGNFTSARASATQAITIYDPSTVRPNPAVANSYTREPFPGNIIPSSRIDPVSAISVNYWAAPNLAGTGVALVNNFIGNVTRADLQDQINTKIDHIFSEKHRTFGRFSYHRQLPGPADLFATVRGASQGGVINIWAHSLALDHTITLSPTLLANFRYGFSRQFWINDPLSLGMDLTTMGFPKSFDASVQERIMPTLNVLGYFQIGESGNNSYIHRGDNMHAAQASFTKSLGRQTLKAGFEARVFLFNDVRAPDATGAFAFNAGYTQQDPLRASAGAGHPFASFLLGHPNTGTMQYFPAASLLQSYYAAYLNDDINVTKKLTLNLGLRWDVETPKTERYDRLSFWDGNVASPLAATTGLPIRGGLRFVGANGEHRSQWDTDYNNFAPRFGFAYRFTPRFVMRGAYGIIFHQTVGQGGAIGHGNDGYGATNQMIATRDGGITTADRLSNPYPDGLPRPAGNTLGLMSRVGGALRPWTGVFNNPYSQRWNFGLQRELPAALLADISYVASRSTGLPIIIQANQMDPQYLALGSQLTAQVPNPFFGIITEGALKNPQVARNLLLRPYPQFDNITYYTPTAQASYHSMQVKLERRFRDSFAWLVSYTLAKALTDAANTGIYGFQSPLIQNIYNMRGEKAISPVDVTHRLVASYQVELPFGKGKRLFSDAPRGVNLAISGWKINGITTVQGGLPLQITTAQNQINAFTGSARPNIASGAEVALNGGESSIQRWFNTAAFSQPAAFTFGTAPRTIPNARVPGLVNFDLSLFKNARITEAVTLQMRFESFNALNHTNFGAPNQVFGNAQFGIIGSANPARQTQIGAKIVF